MSDWSVRRFYELALSVLYLCYIFSHTREVPMFVPESSSKFQKFMR